MTKNEPLVSVIMNCYNCEKYLKEAIDSVYAQTYQNWEIIFWDNASCDQSSEIAKSYDSRLKYFKAAATTQLGEARTLAVKKANGKYLAFLDCDDLWLPEKIKCQVDIFNNSKDVLGLVYGRCEFFYSDVKKDAYKLKDGVILPEGNVFYKLVTENFIPFVSVMVDASIFEQCGGFPSHLKHSPDYWLSLHVAHKYPVGAVQEVCCKYRIHNNNLTNELVVTAALESIEIVSKFLPDKDAKKGEKIQYVKLAFAFLKTKKLIKCIHVLTKNGIWTLFLYLLFRRTMSELGIKHLA